MKKRNYTIKISTVLMLGAVTILFLANSPSEQKSSASKEMVVWYDESAEDVWLDGLFIGNGYMGGNVFGRVKNERIALNESTFWSGRPHDYNDYDAFNYFEEIKELVFTGKFKEAEKMVNDHFYGEPGAQQAYQPLGDLLLNFYVTGDSIRDYYRELNMETGIVKVSYLDGDVKMTREVFMSYPDHVMVMKVTADKPGSISVEAKLGSHFTEGVKTEGDNQLILNGTWKYVPERQMWLIEKVDGTGQDFQTSLVAMPERGTIETTDSSLVISGANSVTFVLTAATSYEKYDDISGDPAAECEEILAKVEGKDYEELKNTHLEDFSELMGRVHLKIGDPMMNERTTDERIAAIKNGQSDPELVAKIFQFGRYILATSSREGSAPANLQGRWNKDLLPNWGSKYTVNINTEMNYWPAEVTNLSECHLPLFDMLEDLAENGAKTAKAYYDADGWVLHHNTDIWLGTAPVDSAKWGFWPMGGAWLCQHIWEHYQFTGDVEFLREYYPIMKGSAQFIMDIMDYEPKYNWLVIPFSISPEQGYFIDDSGVEMYLSPSVTINEAIIKDLFPNCIEAQKILNTDQEFGERLAKALEEIPPYQIGRDGFLNVWIEDWERGNEGHNESPNWGFYPGNSITLRGNPELASAIEKWLKPRREGTGWGAAWDLCVWARLENGARIDTFITDFFRANNLRRGIGNNFNNTSSNQSDANYGFTAGVAECLLQSHAGEISLLPALPTSWKDGSVKGLRARGGFEVDMEWKDGVLTKAEIKSLLGNPCLVRYGEKTKIYDIQKGSTIMLSTEL
jgi:alpha-L-fucosidase 2